MGNLHAHMHQPDLSGQKEIVNEKKNWMIHEALCGKMNGTLQFNRKMGATAMSEGLSDESYHAGGGKWDVHQSETITQSLSNWDHYVIRRYQGGPRASNPSRLSRLHPWAELKDVLCQGSERDPKAAHRMD